MNKDVESLVPRSPFKAFPMGVDTSMLVARTRPLATYTIIAINVVVYLVSSVSRGFLSIAPDWLGRGGFVPVLLAADPQSAYRVLTAMFLHADLLHVFFNMYFLYVFGRPLEGALGSLRFLLLYLASGVIASVAHTAYGFLQGPYTLVVPAIGASGAISGVLGAYMMLFPGTRLSACFWFFLFPICYTMRAAYFLLFWFAMQVVYGYVGVGAAVAFFAHAGGFVAGMALLPLAINRGRHVILKRYAQLSQALFGIVFASGSRVPWGLGRASKTLLSLLLFLMLAGASYVYAFTTVGSEQTYIVELETTIGDMVSTSHVILIGENGELAPIGTEALPIASRIVFNRLWGANLIYNPGLSLKEFSSDQLVVKASVPACDRVYEVPVRIVSLKAKYDENGLMTRGSGLIYTQVINIRFEPPGCSVALGEPFSASFSIRIKPSGNLESLESATSAASLAVTLLALVVVLKLDKQLVIVG
uniref:Rhomboid family intramembrane serine protease n=1 Tax=Fervidicoccus fontis TaxID=683846 RepID=A0A7J3ZLT6_9CREN